MALYRCGGGGRSLDLNNPDVTNIFSSTGGSTTITVTQKPKYIVLATWNASSGSSVYGGMLAVVDVENNSAKRMGYGTNGEISWDNWGGYTGYFTSITSSQVVYKASWSTDTRTRSAILIYY